MQLENNLINEIALGTELNKSVQQSRRSDFSLMLAMLSQDAREMSEFSLPEAKADKVNAQNHNLRDSFDLPEPQALGLKSLDDITLANQAHLAQALNMPAIHLSNAMMPTALAFRDDKRFINRDVVSNTSLHTQKRYYAEPEQQVPNRLTFNAKAWLKAVQQSIVSDSMVGGTSNEPIVENA